MMRVSKRDGVTFGLIPQEPEEPDEDCCSEASFLAGLARLRSDRKRGPIRATRG